MLKETIYSSLFILASKRYQVRMGYENTGFVRGCCSEHLATLLLGLNLAAPIFFKSTNPIYLRATGGKHCDDVNLELVAWCPPSTRVALAVPAQLTDTLFSTPLTSLFLDLCQATYPNMSEGSQMRDSDDNYLASHDQNFKNLAVDYPLQAIEFFAHEVFPKIEGNPKVSFLRQEQQKYNLADPYRELDTPIKLEWPNGEKAIVVFALEAESNPYEFDVIRLAHYCLDLAKQHKTNRVVPVVVFTSAGKFQKDLQLGTEKMTTMQFDFIACQLSQLDYKQWCDSENIVARLTLPLMNYPEEERLEVVHKSTQGLLSLEPSEAFQGKYLPFITHYANLDENDIIEYQQRYPQESEIMLTYTQRLWQEGKQEGVQLGRQEGRLEGKLEGKLEGIGQGERELLLKQLKRRFANKATRVYEAKVMQANSTDIERWAINILDAKTIEEVFS